MYINGQRPHKQAKYTQTKYITQYGPNGQSENCININNHNDMNNGKWNRVLKVNCIKVKAWN